MNAELSAKIGAGLLTLTGLFSSRTFAAEEIKPAANSETLPVTNIIESETEISPRILEVLKSANYQSFTKEQQDSALSIFTALNEPSQDVFLRLLDQSAYLTSSPILLERDFKGKTALETLERIVRNPLHSEIEEKKHEVIEALLLEIENPGRLNQGMRNTCGTSIVYDLYLLYPAEALRIFEGLASKDGQVPLLRPGSLLQRAPYALDILNLDISLSEFLMQSAFMEYANGEHRKYCSICDVHYDPKSGFSSRGLTSWEQASLYRAIYNANEKQCQVIDLKGFGLVPWIKEKYLPGYVPASLRWSEYNGISDYGATHTIVVNDNLRSHRLLGNFRSRQLTGYHRVTILDIKDGRVYFHNLHGSEHHENGTELKNPPRRVEDNQRGIQSMAFSEFSSRIREIIIPNVGKSYPQPRFPKPLESEAPKTNSYVQSH